MSVVDDYLMSIGVGPRAEFTKVRHIVHSIVPNCEEAISYGMPAFKYRKKYLLGFYEFKDHLSLFPGAAPIATLKDQLTGYKTAKGTIQFTVGHSLSKALIEGIVRARIAEIDSEA